MCEIKRTMWHIVTQSLNYISCVLSVSQYGYNNKRLGNKVETYSLCSSEGVICYSPICFVQSHQVCDYITKRLSFESHRAVS